MRFMLALAVALGFVGVAHAQGNQTAGGMSDITVLSVDIGHFDYGHKIIHVYENSRNQAEYRNTPERWQFVIEPLLSTIKGEADTIDYKVYSLDPIIRKSGGYSTLSYAKHRVLIPLRLRSDTALEQALNVILAAYPNIDKCKLGWQNVDVLPLTDITISISDIEAPDGLFVKNAKIHAPSQSFLTSPKELYLSFDIWEKDDSPDKELRRFLDFVPFMQITAVVSFSVKSTKFNLTTIVADKLKGTDLYAKLSGNGGIGYVSRTDLRTLTQKAANQLTANAIVEDPASFDQDLFRSLIAASQTATADEAFFNSQAGKQTYNADDLKPDVVTSEINKLYTKDSGKDEWHFNSSASTNANLLGMISGGASGSMSTSQLHEFLKERNIDNEITGNKIIAKSVQIEQVNLSQFLSSYNFSGEFRNISGNSKQNLKTIIFGEPVEDAPPKGPGTYSHVIQKCPNQNSLLLK
jgi:hypothetical protein